MVSSAASHAPPRCRRHTAKATTASTTGVNSAVAYFTASAAARMAPLLTSRAVRRRNWQSADRIPSHAARASRNSAIASKVARAPRNCVPARVANNAAASTAARCPYRRTVVAHSRLVTPSMKHSDRMRAAARPPDAVRQSAQWRVDDGRPGKVRGEMRDRRLVQPPRPFQMAGPQIEGLVLKCCVGPDEPKRQPGLDSEHHEQWPAEDRLAALIRPSQGAAPDRGPAGKFRCEDDPRNRRADGQLKVSQMPDRSHVPGISRRLAAADQYHARAAMTSDCCLCASHDPPAVRAMSLTATRPSPRSEHRVRKGTVH